MKIRIKESCSAIPFARPGTVREVNDVLARHVIGLGYAEEVTSHEPRATSHVEEGVLTAPETAAARPRRKRGAGALLGNA